MGKVLDIYIWTIPQPRTTWGGLPIIPLPRDRTRLRTAGRLSRLTRRP